MYTPIYFATAPEPNVVLVTSPPAPLTLASFQVQLTSYTDATPDVVDRLNHLRDGYRAAMRDISAGRAQPTDFPLWDATPGRDGSPLGFMSVFSRLNQCAERLGLIRYKFGYRKPL